ncbi:30S ribosomal protein S2 [Candidatus Micrarchaeota archaeon]|nr:30S ribosomal protein S2 [Candidatus Micrarchaeota archaeon]
MSEEKEKVEKDEGLLVGRDVYLESGVHIGTKVRNHDMAKFIFKRRADGLYILDIQQTDERLRKAAEILSRYEPGEVLIVASRVYSSNAASKFAKLTDIELMEGRFVPGALTNLSSKKFKEPKMIFVCDPRGEKQAIEEASKVGVPVIALCDSDNETRLIDFIIPANNKGKKSLALVFYILTREIMIKQGKIKSYDEFKFSPEFFEQLEG